MLRKAIEEWNRRFIFDRAAWVHNSDGFNRAVGREQILQLCFGGLVDRTLPRDGTRLVITLGSPRY